ncbi:MAG: MopE-related protein [Myxococcota bacterium]
MAGRSATAASQASPRRATTCDGKDDNCNGKTDEGYVSLATSCGIGACAASGATSCVAGKVSDSCKSGQPAASDSTCDGKDDNCNGKTDEGYVSLATSCGIGACAASGATSCVAGKVSDSCKSGQPAVLDASCDAIDDDCDGKFDEDYQPSASVCGVGACFMTGLTSCVSGAVHQNCKPGAPAASDATCDGIDDNCNAKVDEGYVSVATSCGTGKCAAVGASSCVGGKVSANCTPGKPDANDASCNAIDNDCDGKTDEEYKPETTSCGIGECALNGQLICVAGGLKDTCVPGAPSCGDAECGADGCGGSCGTCGKGTECAKGFCVPVANCDNLECGPDGAGGSCGTCKPPTACQLAACEAGKCSFPIAGDSCLIKGVCYGGGGLNPANPCQICDPKSDPSDWTTRAKGTVCGQSLDGCVTRTCASAKCVTSAASDFSSCDDKSASSVGDWCHSGVCTGWYQRTEAQYGSLSQTHEAFLLASPLAGGGVYGLFDHSGGEGRSVTMYRSSINGVTQDLATPQSGEYPGLAAAVLAQLDRLWEYVGGTWTNALSKLSLRAAFYDSFTKAHANYRALAHLNGNPERFFAAGTHEFGEGLAVRSCVREKCTLGLCPWSCADDQVFKTAAQGFPVGAAWFNGEPVIGANYGSASAPEVVRIFRVDPKSAMWSAMPALELATKGRTLTAFAGVGGASGGTTTPQWLVGCGNQGLFFVSQLGGINEVIPSVAHPAPTLVSYVAISQFDGRVFVLGTYTKSTTRYHLLFHASLTSDLRERANWQMHELQAGYDNANIKLGPVFVRVMFGLASDSTQMFGLGTALDDSTGGAMRRHVWRWDLPPGGPLTGAEYWDDVKSGVPEPWVVVDQGKADPTSAWAVDPEAGTMRETGNCYDVLAGAATVEKRGTFLVNPKLELGQGTLRVRVKPTDNDGFGVMYSVMDAETYYRFSVDKERSYARLTRMTAGVATVLAEKYELSFAALDQWMVLEVERKGDAHICKLDGETLLVAEDSKYPPGPVALYSWAMGGGGVAFDDVQVFSAK